MWILQLNPVTANAESVVPVVWAKSKEHLEQLLQNEKVDPYQDGRFYKAFKKGGLLEMFNQPSESGESWIGVPSIVDVGTLDDWISETVDRFNHLQNTLFECT